MTICPGCNRAFAQRRKNRQFCAKKCARRFAERVDKQNRLILPVSVPTGTLGAISELMVATDLLSRGFEVFRALSPCASCDLIAQLPGKPPVRIEVKTGWRDRNGKVCSCPTFPERFDMLAIVLAQEIVYQPNFRPQQIGKVA